MEFESGKLSIFVMNVFYHRTMFLIHGLKGYLPYVPFFSLPLPLFIFPIATSTAGCSNDWQIHRLLNRTDRSVPFLPLHPRDETKRQSSREQSATDSHGGSIERAVGTWNRRRPCDVRSWSFAWTNIWHAAAGGKNSGAAMFNQYTRSRLIARRSFCVTRWNSGAFSSVVYKLIRAPDK